MKSIICFENEEAPGVYNILVLKKIRELYPEDLTVMVSTGDFSSDGILLWPGCKERSEEYIKAGADLVLSLPTASILGGHGKKEFAGAALAQNLRISDLLVIIPCTPCSGQTLYDCEKSLRSCSMLMFGEKSDYRSRLSRYMNDLPFREAQKRTVCECAPEAENLLSSPENRQALWLLDAMLQLYYMAKIQFIKAPEYIPCQKSHNNEEHFQKTAVRKIAELLDTVSPEKLTDISGSTSQMVAALFENKESVRDAGSLEQIVSLLLPGPADRIRLFLLKAILEIRKIHMQICGLHTYVPYCYIRAENPDKNRFFKELEERSWVPLIGNHFQEQAIHKEYSYLLQADRKAAELVRIS